MMTTLDTQPQQNMTTLQKCGTSNLIMITGWHFEMHVLTFKNLKPDQTLLISCKHDFETRFPWIVLGMLINVARTFALKGLFDKKSPLVQIPTLCFYIIIELVLWYICIHSGFSVNILREHDIQLSSCEDIIIFNLC